MIDICCYVPANCTAGITQLSANEQMLNRHEGNKAAFSNARASLWPCQGCFNESNMDKVAKMLACCVSVT